MAGVHVEALSPGKQKPGLSRVCRKNDMPGSALACLHARVLLVDNVKTAATTHNLAVAIT